MKHDANTWIAFLSNIFHPNKDLGKWWWQHKIKKHTLKTHTQYFWSLNKKHQVLPDPKSYTSIYFVWSGNFFGKKDFLNFHVSDFVLKNPEIR